MISYNARARAPMATLAALLILSPALQAAPAEPPKKKVDPFETASKQLTDDNPMVRRQGAEKMGRLRDPRGIPLLLKALKDEHPFVRSAIVSTLGRMRVRESTEDILTLLTKDKNAQVRQQAAISLSYLADTSAIDDLATPPESDSWETLR